VKKAYRRRFIIPLYFLERRTAVLDPQEEKFGTGNTLRLLREAAYLPSDGEKTNSTRHAVGMGKGRKGAKTVFCGRSRYNASPFS